MAKYKRKAKEGQITIGEFKAYVSAIEDMFGEDWTPTPDQWKKIRSKINQIDDTVEEVTKEVVKPVRLGSPSPYAAPDTVDENEAAILASFPRGGGGLPPDVVVQPTSALPSAGAAPVMPPVPPTPLRNNPLLSTGGQVKTPDVQGAYETPFV